MVAILFDLLVIDICVSPKKAFGTMTPSTPLKKHEQCEAIGLFGMKLEMCQYDPTMKWEGEPNEEDLVHLWDVCSLPGFWPGPRAVTTKDVNEQRTLRISSWHVLCPQLNSAHHKDWLGIHKTLHPWQVSSVQSHRIDCISSEGAASRGSATLLKG